MAFRTTSPILHKSNDGKGAVVRQCPIGMILTETPYVYDAISAHAYAENGCYNPLDAPPWLQSALRVVGSEKGRLMTLKREEQSAKGDAARARRLTR